MGEILNDFGLEFNGSVKLEAREERLTSEAGAVLSREVDERLGLTRWLGEGLKDTRDEKRITHSRTDPSLHLTQDGVGWPEGAEAAGRAGGWGRSAQLEPTSQGVAVQCRVARMEPNAIREYMLSSMPRWGRPCTPIGCCRWRLRHWASSTPVAPR
jgi:hypothetical protein